MYNVDNENEKEVVEKKDDTFTALLQKFEELKKNSVSRNEYDQLVERNKQIINSSLNENKPDKDDSPKRSIDEIRKEMFGKEHNNLDYAKHACELRERCLEEGKPDPFLPFGSKIVPTEEDKAAAERVYQGFKHCIEYAEGDNATFTNELNRITLDTGIMRRR